MALAKDLPVTEYWDPEWDVYAVPPFPDDGLVDEWFAAYMFQEEISYIRGTDSRYYRPAPFVHQLTTGHE